jgi:predicted DCC family thiol-disulfide oxidoreductase YuxK
MNSSVKTSLNPFRCDGAALPTPLLLMAKVMALAVLLTWDWHAMPDIFIPYFTFLDRIPGARSFHLVLETVIVFSAVLLLFNLLVRPACLAIGCAYLLANLASLPYFTNSRLFTGCLFFILGLCEKDQEPWLIWYQVALLYFGGALNKIMDADWRTGRFFDYWGRIYINERIFLWAVSWLPWGLVALVLSWTTIATEIVLLVGFLVRRFRGWAIWLGLVFHASTIFLTGRPFGFFMYALPASYLAFVVWPEHLTVLYDGDCGFCSRTRKIFRSFEFGDAFRWTPYQTAKDLHGISVEALQKRVHLVVNGRIFSGFAAFQKLLLYNPVTYLVLTVPMTIAEYFRVQRWPVVVLLILFSPIASPVGEAVYNWIARNRHRLSVAASCSTPQSPAS